METLQFFKSEEPIILSKPLIDLLLEQGSQNFKELLVLYIFYYYIAKWQKNAPPTDEYIESKLKWSEAKVEKYQQKLIELGLIKIIDKKLQVQIFF